MRAILLALLLVGCGDTIHVPCNQAILPPSPFDGAVRWMTEDKMTWYWEDECFTFMEMWVWDGCAWQFDRFNKYRIPGCPE